MMERAGEVVFSLRAWPPQSAVLVEEGKGLQNNYPQLRISQIEAVKTDAPVQSGAGGCPSCES